MVHFGGADFLTRFEMVEQICAVMGLDFSLVSAITSAEFGRACRAPAASRVDNRTCQNIM